MADVVIFGVKDFASLAHFYLRHDSPHRVVAFTVHREYLDDGEEFEGLPVVPFEDLERHFPPDRVSAFAPMSYRGMNRLRRDVYKAFKARGYTMISYVSSAATVYSQVPIGDNCFILERNVIQPFASVGNNVVVWSGSVISHHSVVRDHAFLASQTVISGHCDVGESCVVGINATIRDQVKLGEGTLVGMGAIISRNTEPWSLYKAAATRADSRSSLEINL